MPPNVHRLGVVLGRLLVALCCWQEFEPTAHAQLPDPLQLVEPRQATPQEKPERALKPWQAEVKQRLEQIEHRIAEQESDQESQPSAELKRQQELLSWLALSLSQLEAERNKSQQLESYLEGEQEALDKFLQEGLDESEPATFLRLDEARDELLSEQRRLARLREKSNAATAAWEHARQELKQRSSARRLALEASETNRDDSRRRSLGKKLGQAELFNEIAEANVLLKRQEADNARQSLTAHRLSVDLLSEKVARLGTSTQFVEAELQQLFAELDRQKDDLANNIAELEGAETKVKYLNDQWTRAQGQLDASTGDQSALREEVDAHQLGRRAIQERLPLLQKQLERLTDHRKVWQRRQQIYVSRPPRQSIRAWTEETQEKLATLKREQATQLFEIEELQNDLNPRKQQLEEASEGSPEAYWIGQQVGSLQSLLSTHERNRASIRSSLQLHGKLMNELESGTLAATARDRLHDVWDAIGSIWNYELASFGENPLTIRKVVTALALFLAGVVASRALSRSLGRQVLRRLDIDASASATIQSLFYYLLLLFFTLFALNVVRVPLAAFAVLGGAVALGVGFGSQNIINNFISGLILHAERPVKVGDLIQLDDLYGNVEHIGARSTRVRTGSNLEIIVPNSTFLQNNVINFTLSSDKVRTSVEVGVVYGSPVVTVTQLLRRAVVETGRVSKDPPPIILFKDFGASALIFEIHFWIRMRTTMDRLQVESTVRYQIEQLFKEAGITIAFPQQDVHLDTTSPLSVQMLLPPVDAAENDP
ncbi:MAG: mechanosensitive ion channel [Planctomycetes bacterium]|nr:mechanosensitive ion channel [Planctomycetota bacterium]